MPENAGKPCSREWRILGACTGQPSILARYQQCSTRWPLGLSRPDPCMGVHEGCDVVYTPLQKWGLDSPRRYQCTLSSWAEALTSYEVVLRQASFTITSHPLLSQ